MKFTAHVLLPKNSLEDSVPIYLEKVINRYGINYECKPYKDSHCTVKVMMEKFNCTIEQLPLQDDEWIEDGNICFMSTYNKNAHWDWYYLKECVMFSEINYSPASFIDLDGNWYDIDDYGYKMILNDYKKGIIHPDNVKAEQLFKKAYMDFQGKYRTYKIAVLDMHF